MGGRACGFPTVILDFRGRTHPRILMRGEACLQLEQIKPNQDYPVWCHQRWFVGKFPFFGIQVFFKIEVPSTWNQVLPHRLHKQGVLAKQVETCCDVLKMRKPHKSQTFWSWSEGRWAATAGLFILPFVWQIIPRFCGEHTPTFVSSGIFYYPSKHGPILISFPSSKRSQTKVQWNRIQGEQENGKQR